MQTRDFKSMSLDELWKLHEEIAADLSRRMAEERAKLEQRLRTLRSLAGGPDRRPYPKVFPKYRNPKNPTETWSGRGYQPRWLKVQLKSGKKLDDFLIRGHSSKKRPFP